MHYRMVFILCSSLLSNFSYTQTWDAIRRNEHIDYRELFNPKPFDRQSWNAIERNVLVSFGDVNTRYEKNNLPSPGMLEKNWSATAWRGEKVHTQIVIVSKMKLLGILKKYGSNNLKKICL